MFSPLLNIAMQYGVPVVAGIAVSLLFKAIFAHQMQGKIKEYQHDIVRSHAKILELEAKNEKLEKHIKNLDLSFSKDRIFMN